MSGQLAMQEGKLIVQDGKLGFCCCPACQWRVLWTFDCGACSEGAYPSKGYVVGTPEKITADFQTPGDYPNEDNTLVMRYGASPAEACDTPAEGDLDTTTPPAVSPATSPCLVNWEGHAELFRAEWDPGFTSCEDCYAAMTAQGEYAWLQIDTAKPDTEAINCPPAGTRSNTGDCADGVGCADYKFDGTCRKVCPPS